MRLRTRVVAGRLRRMPTRLSDAAFDEQTWSSGPVRRALWNVTSSDIATIVCPTCGASQYALCRTLRDRPTTALHRGRTLRYLNVRFALDLREPHHRSVQRRSGLGLDAAGLRAVRMPHPQPWRLPLPELSDLINVSFFDLAKVVTAQACGVRRTGLDELLHGPDRIEQSIDALTYALYDRQIRREIRILSGQCDETARNLKAQQQAVWQQLREAERRLKAQRVEELTTAGVLPFPPATDDSRRVARAWLGRYLSAEKDALVLEFATAAGVPAAAAAPIRCIQEKITRCIDNGWLIAPLNDAVRSVLALDESAFRKRLLTDAGRQDERDDVLCHPLVLNRWRDQLNECLRAVAPGADNPHTKHLTDLTRTPTPRTTAQLKQLQAQRRLFAALLQRRAEAVRLITTLNDGLSIAERGDPSHALLKQAGDQAYDELVRRHPDLYQRIRAHLAGFETRYGRLQIPGSRTRLREQIFEELDRAAVRTRAGVTVRR
ncbi:hypothetical protein ACFWFH_05970 [Streptomyces coelicoflavus]|uniref:hypothetical protein n=2 Tax=Streptomyces coelicoflavus TaxID=285562 RepID=UPI0036693848